MRKVRAICDPTVILVNSSLVMATQGLHTSVVIWRSTGSCYLKGSMSQWRSHTHKGVAGSP